MERIRQLDKFQKIILIALAVMLVYYAVAYGLSTSRKGFAYMETIFVAEEQNGNLVYSGKLEGKTASFTVTPDKAVTFRHGDKTYGPYTAKEDPTAVPEGESGTGVEILDNGKVFFRGSVTALGEGFWLVKEDGTSDNFYITATMSDGTVVDGNGNIVDPMEPSAHTILEMMRGPDLTSYKGFWFIWFFGAAFSAVTVVTMLYADELFRWKMSWRVIDPAAIEPSDWELASRYIGWAGETIIVLVFYQMGLNYLH